MSPKPGDRAAPPPFDQEYDIRFANTEAADGWEHLGRQAANNLRRAYEKIRANPRARDRPDRQHRLRGNLGAAAFKGQILERWLGGHRRRTHLVPPGRRHPHRLDHLCGHRPPQGHRLATLQRT